MDELDGDTSSIAALTTNPGGAGISLREAITAANQDAAADTILFAAATNGIPFTLTRVGDEDANLQGDLDVLQSLTITGNGPTNTIIQGGTDATNGIDKVFALNPLCDPGLDFSLSGMTVQFGRNTGRTDCAVPRHGRRYRLVRQWRRREFTIVGARQHGDHAELDTLQQRG